MDDEDDEDDMGMILLMRYARVANYSDELYNGTHVEVCGFDPSSITYTVRCQDVHLHLKADQLELYTPAPFLSLFPKAPIVSGRHDMTRLPRGSVIDFSNADTKIKSFEPLKITGSCRVVGKQIYMRKRNFNTINNHILIKAKENDVVEFENLYFEPAKGATWTIDCVRGQITFKNCTFANCRNVVTIGIGGHKSVNVSFEKCTFNSVREYALLIEGGSVVVVECLFRSVGMAAIVRESAHLSVHHSRFTHWCTGGILVKELGGIHRTLQLRGNSGFLHPRLASLACDCGFLHSRQMPW